MFPVRRGPDDCYGRISNPALKVWKRTRNMPRRMTACACLTKFPLSATTIKTRLSLYHLLRKTRPILQIWNECIFVLTAPYIYFHQNSYYNAIFLVLLSYYTKYHKLGSFISKIEIFFHNSGNQDQGAMVFRTLPGCRLLTSCCVLTW